MMVGVTGATRASDTATMWVISVRLSRPAFACSASLR